MPIIEVKHLTKEYSLGTVTSIKDTLRYGLAKLTGKQTWHREKFKALDDVNFTIEEGEVVGIIGQNGAGKSTLLKHLASITTPTKGEVIVRGSIAPLIEVGAGVNPELTGRENIFLNGAILGIPKKVINQKLDEIIEFSELEQFIDTPVKRYSSGMTVKLGFSIATSMDADILIIDEVLAVGDLAFQRKCFDRMEDMIKNQGKTVLLVSHNIRQVQRMCSRVVLLDHGKILADGDPQQISELFYEKSNKIIMEYQKNIVEKNANIQSSGELELLDINIIDKDGNPIDEIKTNGHLRVRIQFKLNTSYEQPEIVIGTHRTDFYYLTAGSTSLFPNRPNLNKGVHEVDYIVHSFPLIHGTYCVRFAFLDKNRRMVYSGETLKTFNVKPSPFEALEPISRTLNIDHSWKIEGHSFHSKNIYDAPAKTPNR